MVHFHPREHSIGIKHEKLRSAMLYRLYSDKKDKIVGFYNIICTSNVAFVYV